MRPVIPALLLAAALAACGSVNLGTATRLSQLDPISADPSAFAARLSLPEGLTIPPKGAMLELRVIRSDTNEQIAGRFALRQNGGVWSFSPDDAARLRKLQTQAKIWKRTAPKASKGRLSLRLTGCRAGSGPKPDAPISADISLDGGATFLPLLRGLTVSDLLAPSSGPELTAPNTAPLACPTP